MADPRPAVPPDFAYVPNWPRATCPPTDDAVPQDCYLLLREGEPRDYLGPLGFTSILSKLREGRVAPLGHFSIVQNPGRLRELELEAVDYGYNKAPLLAAGDPPDPAADGLVKLTLVYHSLKSEAEIAPFLV